MEKILTGNKILIDDDNFFYNYMKKNYPNLNPTKPYKKFYLHAIYYIDKLKREFKYTYETGDPKYIYEKLSSLINKKIKSMFENIPRGKILDISNTTRYDIIKIRVIFPPSSLSLKKQIGNYDVYSDNINAIQIFQKLVGNYELEKLWKK